MKKAIILGVLLQIIFLVILFNLTKGGNTSW